MTCIVGIELSGPERVLIAGDSAGVSGTDLEDRLDEKVFAVGPFVVGIAGCFRMGQILRYRWKPPEHQNGVDATAFMVRDVVESLRRCFLDNGTRFNGPSGDSHSGQFLMGYRGNLYKVDSDFQVGRSRLGYAAVGSGSRVALGALHALTVSAEDQTTRARMAMIAAAQHDSAVRAPFVFLEGGRLP